MKEAVGSGRYRLNWNNKRQDNINLFPDYVIDEAQAYGIIFMICLLKMEISAIFLAIGRSEMLDSVTLQNGG